MNQQPRSRGRLQFILLALVFIGPLAMAFYLYYGTDGWRPSGQTNHGELIEPVIAIPEVPLDTLGGRLPAAQLLRDRWTIVYVNRGPCDEICRDEITKIRQIRLTLGAEAERVERLYLHGREQPDEKWLARTQKGLVVASLEENPVLAEALPGAASAIYFVDPLGNLMMRFPAHAPPADIKDDLKKLLKISRIG